jgi:hypothetical protein
VLNGDVRAGADHDSAGHRKPRQLSKPAWIPSKPVDYEAVKRTDENRTRPEKTKRETSKEDPTPSEKVCKEIAEGVDTSQSEHVTANDPRHDEVEEKLDEGSAATQSKCAGQRKACIPDTSEEKHRDMVAPLEPTDDKGTPLPEGTLLRRVEAISLQLFIQEARGVARSQIERQTMLDLQDERQGTRRPKDDGEGDTLRQTIVPTVVSSRQVVTPPNSSPIRLTATQRARSLTEEVVNPVNWFEWWPTGHAPMMIDPWDGKIRSRCVTVDDAEGWQSQARASPPELPLDTEAESNTMDRLQTMHEAQIAAKWGPYLEERNSLAWHEAQDETNTETDVQLLTLFPQRGTASHFENRAPVSNVNTSDGMGGAAARREARRVRVVENEARTSEKWDKLSPEQKCEAESSQNAEVAAVIDKSIVPPTGRTTSTAEVTQLHQEALEVVEGKMMRVYDGMKESKESDADFLQSNHTDLLQSDYDATCRTIQNRVSLLRLAHDDATVVERGRRGRDSNAEKAEFHANRRARRRERGPHRMPSRRSVVQDDTGDMDTGDDTGWFAPEQLVNDGVGVVGGGVVECLGVTPTGPIRECEERRGPTTFFRIHVVEPHGPITEASMGIGAYAARDEGTMGMSMATGTTMAGRMTDELGYQFESDPTESGVVTGNGIASTIRARNVRVMIQTSRMAHRCLVVSGVMRATEGLNHMKDVDILFGKEFAEDIGLIWDVNHASLMWRTPHASLLDTKLQAALSLPMMMEGAPGPWARWLTTLHSEGSPEYREEQARCARMEAEAANLGLKALEDQQRMEDEIDDTTMAETGTLPPGDPLSPKYQEAKRIAIEGLKDTVTGIVQDDMRFCEHVSLMVDRYYYAGNGLPCDLLELEIKMSPRWFLEGSPAIYAAPYPMHPMRREKGLLIWDTWVDQRFVERWPNVENADAPIHEHPLILSWSETTKKLRLCADMRELNKKMDKIPVRLPDLWDTIHRVAAYKYMASIDVSAAYCAIPIKKESRHMLGVRNPRTGDLWCFARLIFGMLNASHHWTESFRRMLTRIRLPKEIPTDWDSAMKCEMEWSDDELNLGANVYSHPDWEIVGPYVDDVFLGAMSAWRLLQLVGAVLRMCQKHYVPLNWKKLKVGLDKMTVLGHTIDTKNSTIAMCSRVRERIGAWMMPQTEKAWAGFAGTVAWGCRHFHPGAMEYLKTLHARLVDPAAVLRWKTRVQMDEASHKKAALLRGSIKLQYDEEDVKMFEGFRDRMAGDSFLVPYDENRPIVIACDASQTGYGAILVQYRPDIPLPPGMTEIIGMDKGYRMVDCMSGSFDKHMRAENTTARELYAARCACLFWMFWIATSKFTVTLRTDHSAVCAVANSRNRKMLEWGAVIASCGVIIEHVPGSLNWVADTLSCIGSPAAWQVEPEREEVRSSVALVPKESQARITGGMTALAIQTQEADVTSAIEEGDTEDDSGVTLGVRSDDDPEGVDSEKKVTTTRLGPSVEWSCATESVMAARRGRGWDDLERDASYWDVHDARGKPRPRNALGVKSRGPPRLPCMESLFPDWEQQLREDIVKMRRSDSAEFRKLSASPIGERPGEEDTTRQDLAFHPLVGAQAGLYGKWVRREGWWEVAVYVPEERRRLVLWVLHNPTHRSGSEMWRLLAEAKMTWANAIKQTERFSDNCSWCRVRDKKDQPRRIDVPASIRMGFEDWIVDQLELYPDHPDPDRVKNEGGQYEVAKTAVIVFVNCATRFCVLVAVKDLKAVSVTEAVDGLYQMFGRLGRIIADAASYFGKMERIRMGKIDPRIESISTTAPVNHRGVGLVECRMGLIKSLLNNLLMGSLRWTRMLPDLQNAMNDKRCRVTGYTPREIMTPGVKTRGVFEGMGVEEKLVNAVGGVHWETELLGMDEERVHAILEVAERRALASLDRGMSEWMKNAARQWRAGAVTRYPYKIGDWALVDLRLKDTDKTPVRWTGPYRVVEMDATRGRYLLEVNDQVKRVKEIPRSGDRMMRWFGSESEQWIADRVGSGVGVNCVAVADGIVDDHLFVDEKGAIARWFRVRWSGFGHGDDSWKEAKEIQHLNCYREYVAKQKVLGVVWATDETVEGKARATRRGATKRKVSFKKAKEDTVLEEKSEINPGDESVEQEVKKDDVTGINDATRVIDEEQPKVVDEMVEQPRVADPMEAARGCVADVSDQLEREAETRRLALRQGRKRDHSGETWPGGRFLDQYMTDQAIAVGKKLFQEEGDEHCTECIRKGLLVQCDFCCRAYHARCAGLARIPLPEERWACVWCSHDVWPLGESAVARL